MGVLDHWQPVYLGRRLKPGTAAGVTLAGRSVCVFRTRAGAVGAIDDVCSHRRMRLSAGKVVGDRIECLYHGWRFDACGQGESPGTPKMTACTESFDVREEHGAIWMKSRTSDPPFPEIRADGYYPIGTFFHVAPAPLELVLDNFTEVEHTATVHQTFGYDLGRMSEVQVRVESTDTSVSVVNSGPSKRLFRPLAWLLGIRNGDLFHDEWTTYFSPVYSVFDHFWTSPDGSREAMVRWRVFIVFWPIDGENTGLTSFAFAKSRYPGPTGGLRQAKIFFRREFNRELRRDVDLLRHLASRDVSVEGMKLSRFDKVLWLQRERIDRIYRGSPTPEPTAPSRIPLTG